MGEPLSKPSEAETALERAKELISAAIMQLDEAGAPSDVAAHLDLALNRLSAP